MAATPTRRETEKLVSRTGAPLRLGVVVTGPRVRRWEIAALEALAAGGGGRVVAILAVGDEAVPRHWTRLIEGIERHVVRGLDGQVGEARARDAFPEARVVRLPEVTSAEALSRVRELGLDAIVSLGRSGDAGDLAVLAGGARHGLVECHYEGSGGEAALARVLAQRPLLVHIEVRRTPADGSPPEVLDASLASIGREPLLSKTEARVFGRTTVLLLRALRRLAELPSGGDTPAASSLEPRERSVDESEGERGIAAEVGDMLRFCARAADVFLRYRLRNLALGPEQWFLAYRTDAARFVANRGTFRGDGLRVLEPPAGWFHADPSVIEREGRHHVFLEACPFASPKGIISWTELQPDGSLAEPVPVLERPYHLSYPFVFEWEGDVFMVPETADNRTVELYRAADFPRGWELVSVLLDDVVAADATLFCDGDRWWMFVTLGGEGSFPCDELFLFHAATPLGPWAPHPMNPVKSDARSARPAGALFRSGGRLLRPAQDCSETYGGALVLCEVLELTQRVYRERIVERATPDWLPGNTALHTLSASSRLEVIDGRRRSGRRRARPA